MAYLHCAIRGCLGILPGGQHCLPLEQTMVWAPPFFWGLPKAFVKSLHLLRPSVAPVRPLTALY